jgi:predicted nucleic acid-binding protein
MKFVVDTNVILSSLIKDSLTRKIIKNIEFEFYAPSFSLSEINKYKKYVCEKASITEKQFDILLKNLFENIEIVPIAFYEKYIKTSKKLIEDVKDVPFLACAIALKADIWSDDKGFKKQKETGIFTTQEFIKKFLKV